MDLIFDYSVRTADFYDTIRAMINRMSHTKCIMNIILLLESKISTVQTIFQNSAYFIVQLKIGRVNSAYRLSSPPCKFETALQKVLIYISGLNFSVFLHLALFFLSHLMHGYTGESENDADQRIQQVEECEHKI